MVLRKAEDQRDAPSHPRCPHSSISQREVTITALHGTEELQCTKAALIPAMLESAHSNKGIKELHQ